MVRDCAAVSPVQHFSSQALGGYPPRVLRSAIPFAQIAEETHATCYPRCIHQLHARCTAPCAAAFCALAAARSPADAYWHLPPARRHLHSPPTHAGSASRRGRRLRRRRVVQPRRPPRAPPRRAPPHQRPQLCARLPPPHHPARTPPRERAPKPLSPGPPPQNGSSALHIACTLGRPESAGVLLALGADAAAADASGNTSLALACAGGRAACARLLLRRGGACAEQRNYVRATSRCCCASARSPEWTRCGGSNRSLA